MQRFAMINGKFVPEDQAAISVFDRGFLYGDGLFETVRVYQGKVFRLDRHLKRLANGLKTLRFSLPFTMATMTDQLNQLIRRNVIGDGLARLIVTRGQSDFGLSILTAHDPLVVIYAQPHAGHSNDKYAQGFRVIIARERANAQSTMEMTKTISRVHHVLAKMEADEARVDDAILLNTDGHLAEGSTSNLFLIRDETVLTAPIETGLLPGITREIIQNLATQQKIPVQEGKFTAEDLYRADEAFLSSTLMELMPVVEVSGHTIGTGSPGPITLRLHAAYRKLVAEELG